MSCFNNSCYLPQPARAWSRVQNSCSLTTNIDNNGLVKIPYSNQLVPASALGLKMAMLNKGNVLQYKANSSNLTQSQKYSKIVKGLHIRFVVEQNNIRFTGIGFNMADKFHLVQSNQPLDIVFTLDENIWNGETSLQLKVIDIKLSVSSTQPSLTTIN